MSRVPPAIPTRLGTTPRKGLKGPAVLAFFMGRSLTDCIPRRSTTLSLRRVGGIFPLYGSGAVPLYKNLVTPIARRRAAMASVRIRWVRHSGFSIRDGKTALIDPWLEGNPKAPGGVDTAPVADLLLLTHDHFDHAGDAVALAKKTGALVVAIFELAGELKAKGVPA